MTDKSKEYMQNMFKVGTPECAISMGLVGLVLGVMFLLLGFWQTILDALIVIVFAFLGGVKDKKAFIAKFVNRVFPQKTDNFPGIENAGKVKTEPHYAPDVPDFSVPEKKDGQDA